MPLRLSLIPCADLIEMSSSVEVPACEFFVWCLPSRSRASAAAFASWRPYHLLPHITAGVVEAVLPEKMLESTVDVAGSLAFDARALTQFISLLLDTQ